MQFSRSLIVAKEKGIDADEYRRSLFREYFLSTGSDSYENSKSKEIRDHDFKYPLNKNGKVGIYKILAVSEDQNIYWILKENMGIYDCLQILKGSNQIYFRRIDIEHINIEEIE